MKTGVAIVGGGPAGSVTSMWLSKIGIRSTIVEREGYPRFHIGESMTGECGNAVRALGLEQEMNRRRHPIKYGVKVYGAEGRNSFWVPVMSRTPEGELQGGSTWQVRRSDFDEMLLDEAVARGAVLVKGRAIEPLRDAENSIRGVRLRRPTGEIQEIDSEVLVDASGSATFLCSAGVTSQKERGNYINQVAIFSHVTGAIRDPGKDRDNTLIFYQKKNHWAWFIPVDAEVVSIGVVVPSAYFTSKQESKHEFLFREMRELNSELAARVPKVELVEDVRAITNYSYHVKEFTGKGYLCVGDSHRFVDPVFSFGLYFALAEARSAADAIEAHLGRQNHETGNPFSEYQRRVESGQDVIQTLIDAFWNSPLAFGFFVHERYVDDFIDLFAGRVYADEPSPGLIAMQSINAERAALDAAMVS